MSMSDPLGDMLTRIRNGQNARKSVVSSPASRFRSNVLEVLKREGYIRNYSSVDIRPGLKELKIELKYHEGQPVISEIKRVSRPGRRVYYGHRSFPGIEVPYISAIVDLDGGGTIKGNLINVKPDSKNISFDMRVRIIFKDALGRKDKDGNSYISYFFKPI